MEDINRIYELDTRSRLLSNGIAVIIFLVLTVIFSGISIAIIAAVIMIPFVFKILSIPYDRLDLRNEDKLVLLSKSEDLSVELMFEYISRINYDSIDIEIEMIDKKKYCIAYPKDLKKEDLISYFLNKNIETHEKMGAIGGD